jgi:ketol-acid reductoisomerase
MSDNLKASIVTERDVPERPLAGRRVAVVGYGSQGEAQALNLRDADVDVCVGLREGSPSAKKARGSGIQVVSIETAARSDVIALLVPDDALRGLFERDVAPALEAGRTVVLAHGFSVRYGGLDVPPGVDLVLVAPMGPGRLLRERYLAGTGLPAAFAVHRDATGEARRTATEYGAAIGCARVGLFETTVNEETEVDLFAEQAVLVGGVTRLVESAFQTLVESGYDPAIAYMECLFELELTVNLMHRYGISGMRDRISRTALYGDLTRGDRIIGEEARAGMRRILEDIRDGSFARELEGDLTEGGRVVERELAKTRERLIARMEKELATVAHPERDAERP